MNSGCLGYDLRHKTLKCITLKNYLVNITFKYARLSMKHYSCSLYIPDAA